MRGKNRFSLHQKGLNSLGAFQQQQKQNHPFTFTEEKQKLLKEEQAKLWRKLKQEKWKERKQKILKEMGGSEKDELRRKHLIEEKLKQKEKLQQGEQNFEIEFLWKKHRDEKIIKNKQFEEEMIKLKQMQLDEKLMNNKLQEKENLKHNKLKDEKILEWKLVEAERLKEKQVKKEEKPGQEQLEREGLKQAQWEEEKIFHFKLLGEEMVQPNYLEKEMYFRQPEELLKQKCGGKLRHELFEEEGWKQNRVKEERLKQKHLQEVWANLQYEEKEILKQKLFEKERKQKQLRQNPQKEERLNQTDTEKSIFKKKHLEEQSENFSNEIKECKFKIEKDLEQKEKIETAKHNAHLNEKNLNFDQIMEIDTPKQNLIKVAMQIKEEKEQKFIEKENLEEQEMLKKNFVGAQNRLKILQDQKQMDDDDLISNFQNEAVNLSFNQVFKFYF